MLQLLERLRANMITDADYNTLIDLVISDLNTNDPKWKHANFVTVRNPLRTALNYEHAQQQAKAAGVPLIVAVAEDVRKLRGQGSASLEARRRKCVLQLADNKTDNLPGLLPLYPGQFLMLRDNKAGFFPYTPSTNILYGLREALGMMRDEGLEAIWGRHERFGRATRAAVKAWGLDIVAQNPAEYSGVLTAVVMPDGRDADAFRQIVLERFDMSLGTGLGKLKGKIFRIGHLGDFNDLMLAGTLSGVEMGLALAGVPHKSGGVLAALELLTAESLAPVS